MQSITITPRKKLSEIGVSDLIKKKRGSDNYSERPLATVYDIYIVGPIEEPEEYIEIFDKIRNAGEFDVVKLHINSPGGYLSTAIQFIRCMRECSGRIIASIEGECMSAATMLMLEAHSYEISEHSMIMLHCWSGGMGGKANEIRDRARFDDNWTRGFFHDIYKDFMTKAEIDLMIDGKDYWLSSNETIERLKKRAKAREKAVKAELKKGEKEADSTEESTLE